MKQITLLFIFISYFFQCASLFGASFVVNSNQDYADNNPGDGTCDTGYTYPDNCTLRAAIEEANADTLTRDIITFSRQLDFSYATLPPTYNLIIDGSSQWNTTDKVPGIQIGAGLFYSAGLEINGRTVVRGVLFYGDGTGISIKNSSEYNQIGGSGLHERNIFFTSDTGIYLKQGVSSTTIAYNYFGTKNGEALFPADDVFYGTYGIKAWGTSMVLIAHNIIGEHSQAGIYLNNCSGTVTIENNHIGVFGTTDSRKLPNVYGIRIAASAGTTTINNNIIAGNISGQIHADSGFDHISITDNQIGSSYALISASLSQANGIELFGSQLHYTNITGNSIEHNNGIGIFTTSGCPTIENNYIASNGGDGIKLANIVDASLCNVSGNTINSNTGNGIVLDNANKVHVNGNWIGLDRRDFFNAGNGLSGIRLANGSAGNIIGGSDPTDANYISHNHASGIYITGTGTSHNQVGGNVIGCGLKIWTGGYLKAGNGNHGIAVYDHADENYIGLLDDTISPNLVIDSHWGGIVVINSNGNLIFGNMVGTDGDSRQWGNAYAGIQINGRNNAIRFNTVANNGFGPTPAWAGIIIQGATSYGNNIHKNSIFHNGAAGIDLRDGANRNIAAPHLERAGNIISGTTCPSCRVSFFSGPDTNEGKFFEGIADANTSGIFSWRKQGNFQGKYVTATATTTSAEINTSGFSSPVQGYIFPWPLFLPALMKH